MFYGRSSGGSADRGGGGGQRRERFDQMTKQQQLIEQKKREIQARLEAEKHKKEMELMLKKAASSAGGRGASSSSSSNKSYGDSDVKPSSSSLRIEEKKESVPNVFANDGSFLEHFKRMQEQQKKKDETKKVEEETKIKEEPTEVNEYGSVEGVSPVNNNKPSIKIINVPARSASPAQELNQNSNSSNNNSSSSNSGNSNSNIIEQNKNVMSNVAPPSFYHQIPPPPPPPPSNQQQQQNQDRFYNSNLNNFNNKSIPPPQNQQQQNTGAFPSQAVKQLAQQVAEAGDHIEEMARVENQDDPLMWFLFKPLSNEYRRYRELVNQYKNENQYQSSNFQQQSQEQQHQRQQQDRSGGGYSKSERKRRNSSSSSSSSDDDGRRRQEEKRSERHRRRRSRWGPQSDSDDSRSSEPKISPNNFETNANMGFPSSNSNSNSGLNFTSPPIICNPSSSSIQNPTMITPVPPPSLGLGINAPFNMAIPPPGLINNPTVGPSGIQNNYPAMMNIPPPPPPPPLPTQAHADGQMSAIGNFPLMSSMDFNSQEKPSLTKVTRQSRELLAYANQAYGTTNLDEEQWKQCEEAYKMNLIFQDIARKKARDEQFSAAGKFKHEYDSDEEIDGGTWEHKQRMKEMEKTQQWASELTVKAKGKHHIGDFLPPDELAKFMEKYKAVKEGRELNASDYQEFKIAESNVGFKMLQKMGWADGQGLGSSGQGITQPIEKGNVSSDKQGLGQEKPGDLTEEDDEYTAYRKRMMLAYRFRPNPLNNPRRAYY